MSCGSGSAIGRCEAVFACSCPRGCPRGYQASGIATLIPRFNVLVTGRLSAWGSRGAEGSSLEPAPRHEHTLHCPGQAALVMIQLLHNEVHGGSAKQCVIK